MKMKMNKYAGTAFIKVDGFGGPKCKTIENVEEGNYGMPVITFSDGKRLSLNKTNTNTLIELFGDDSDDWVGQRIELYVGPLRYQGTETDGIKVRRPGSDEKPEAAVASASAARDDMDDEIPF
jgi:hypothetical protein